MAIVLIVLGVYLFSIVIQVQQITALVYKQQERFFTHEAEEIAQIFNQYDTGELAINERLDNLTKVLKAHTAIIDSPGNISYGQVMSAHTAIIDTNGKVLYGQAATSEQA